ncbi:MAG: hypothetical protein J5714_01035 [Alphaproteobacteria bacterium]|nr:hypothetical protein [Alphaproteobacteria bacterium]
MTLQELATNFVNKYEEEIKRQLGIKTFDKKVAIECVADFFERETAALINNAINRDAFSSKNGMIKDIIGSMYEQLVPAHIRKLHEATAKIEGQNLGKVLTQIVKTATKAAIENADNTIVVGR